MYPKLDIENINKIENSLEGQKYDIKRIIKILILTNNYHNLQSQIQL